MNKTELIAAVAENAELSKKDAEKALKAFVEVVTDSLGNVTSELIIQEAASGNNITLTIDYRIQNVVENALKNTLQSLQNGSLGKEQIPEAQAGSCVVLDVETGEVLAMASYPTYNINNFANGITSKQ